MVIEPIHFYVYLYEQLWKYTIHIFKILRQVNNARILFRGTKSPTVYNLKEKCLHPRPIILRVLYAHNCLQTGLYPIHISFILIFLYQLIIPLYIVYSIYLPLSFSYSLDFDHVACCIRISL